jgi:hypothetical protein
MADSDRFLFNLTASAGPVSVKIFVVPFGIEIQNLYPNLIIMKSFSIISLLFALCSLHVSAQTGIEKKLIATLGPGETLANGENCFLLDKNPESISFVTVVGSGSAKEYYYYGKDGKKSGPVKSPDPSFWAERNNENIEDCIADKEHNVANPEEYIDYATGSIKFQGKTYGPFGQVIMFYLSDNEQNFYAVALSAEMKIFFFDKNSRKVELNGLPNEIIISPDGSKAFATVKGSINPFEPDAAQKMMNNPEELNNPKINLIGIDGSKYGPYTSGDYNDAWYISSGKLVIYANKEVSLDGKVLFKSEDYVSKCDMWISSNGKDYAWANYENIMFSDGSKYTAPLVIKYVETGGKGFLKWIALEDAKNLAFYRKPF